jgi:hypothetical protein
VKHGILAALLEGATTAAAVARATGLDGGRVFRVLRGRVWAGLAEQTGDERFVLTAAGRGLADTGPLSAGAGLVFQGEFFYRAWGEFERWVTDGAVPWDAAYGEPFFPYLAKRPKLQALFDAPMAARSTDYSLTLAKHPAFDGAKRIVDVGGGNGQLLADILTVRTAARGAVLDMPGLAERARTLFADRGVAERCEFVGGDMFRAVPAGADVYLLKWILHDWDDEKSIAILARIVEAMPANATVMVVERIMPDRVDRKTGLVQADLNMLVFNGGVERTRDEWARLAERAGLTVVRTTLVEDWYRFYAIEMKRAT